MTLRPHGLRAGAPASDTASSRSDRDIGANQMPPVHQGAACLSATLWLLYADRHPYLWRIVNRDKPSSCVTQLWH